MTNGRLLVQIGIVVALGIGGATAGTSECYSIKDGDKRAYCLAQVKRDYGYCYRIKDGENRNQCLGEIKGSRDRCNAIKEADTRTQCLVRIPRNLSKLRL